MWTTTEHKIVDIQEFEHKTFGTAYNLVTEAGEILYKGYFSKDYALEMIGKTIHTLD